MKKIAITGGAGYVGSALVPYLLKLGYAVKVVDLFLYGEDGLSAVKDSPRLESVRVDIRDSRRLLKELKGIDAVIHLACISNDPSFELNPKLGKSINYDAFPGLLEAVKQNGVRRFIYASSSSVYGVKKELHVTEEMPCEPLTDYSKYKMLCEEMLRSADLGGCDYTIVRPATVCGYAPRMRLDLTVNVLTIHALVRKAITVFGGDQLRPNLHIDDMIEVYRILLESPGGKIHRETFNAGYENVTVMRLAEMVKEKVQDPSVTIRVEPTSDHRSYHINSDKIKRVLGFEPRHTIPDAIESICVAYRKGLIPDPLIDSRYYNIQTMKKARLSQEPDSTPSDFKVSLYRQMLRIRLVEERIAQLYPQQQMRCPTHLYIGQEAVAVGACAALSRDDYLFGTYRAHGIYLAKGGNLKALIAELYGKQTGITRGRGGSMQLVAPEVNFLCASAIVGGTLPMAVGAALAARFHAKGQVSLALFGDGATEEGVFHESLNFASLKKLPVVFVCENNFYATYSHQSARQCADNIYKRAQAYEMPGIRLDGNDVLAVYEKTKEAVERARKGEGPSLLECRTYRWREHVGPYWDTELGYRTEEELASWMARCPVKTFEEHLRKEGTLSDGAVQKMTQELTQELGEAFVFAQQSPFPHPNELDRWVYAENDANNNLLSGD